MNITGLQANYNEHVLTKSEYLAQKRGKYNKSDFPNKPPRIFYFNGAEYYFNTYTGKDKQFMNYRWRDYNWYGSLKFHLKDSRMTPKILKDHYQLWKELKKPRTFSSTEAQRKFDIVVDSELEQSKDSIESACNIWERIARKAREFSALERKHIYPPDRKQFVKRVRLVRKSLNPKTADDKFVFAEETGKSVNGESFVRYSTIFTDPKGQKQHNILWASSFQINLMRNWKQLFIDSTYQSVPRYFYQLLTISAFWSETNTTHPWGYCLMTSRSRDSYSQLFNYLKIQFSIYPHVWIIDLDANLKDSMLTVYPNSITMMCFRALKRSLYLKLKTMGVMSSESTSDKIQQILDGVSQNIFRTADTKDSLLLQVDRMHREAGPEFDEFYESLKKFVSDHYSVLHYETIKIIANPLVEEMYSRIIQKWGVRPRLVAFIQKLKEEENHYRLQYENIKNNSGQNTNESTENPIEENYNFEEESEDAIKARRKIFLIEENESDDDEMEDRYYSDKSSDWESDDFTDTKKNIELLKKIKLERLKRMEKLSCPDPKDFKTEEEYKKAVKDYKATSFTESYFDSNGNTLIRDRLRTTSDGKSFLGRKRGNRVFISTMWPDDDRLNEVREYWREEERKRGKIPYHEIKLEDYDYSTALTQIKYEDGENAYMWDEYDSFRGNSKIFEIRHEPKKPDPLQKFKERILKKEQSRAAAAAAAAESSAIPANAPAINTIKIPESNSEEKVEAQKIKTKVKKGTGLSTKVGGSLMNSIMKKRDGKQNKADSKNNEKDKEKDNNEDKEEQQENEKKDQDEKTKDEKIKKKKFKFGTKDKNENADIIDKRTQGRSGEAKEDDKKKSKKKSSSSENSDDSGSESSDSSSDIDKKVVKKKDKQKKVNKSESDSESDSDDKLKKKNKKSNKSRSRSKSNTETNKDKGKKKKDSQATTTSTSRNLRGKKKEDESMTPPNHEEKMPDNEMTRKLRKRKPIKFGDSSD